MKATLLVVLFLSFLAASSSSPTPPAPTPVVSPPAPVVHEEHQVSLSRETELESALDNVSNENVQLRSENLQLKTSLEQLGAEKISYLQQIADLEAKLANKPKSVSVQDKATYGTYYAYTAGSCANGSCSTGPFRFLRRRR